MIFAGANKMNRSVGSWKPFFLTMVLGAPVAYWLFSHPVAPPTAAYAQQVVDSQHARGGLVNPTGVAGADQLSKVFRDVAKSLKPSVVSVKNVVEQSATRTRQLFGVPLEDFSGGEDGFDTPKGRFENGLGSGVIVRNDGYILTNNHVVEGASILEVVLSDDRKFIAKVIGTDKRTDLAILKIDATGLVPAKLGSSESMEVGDWVIAIGSPFGLSQTVTAGIVSATNRSDQGITPYDNFIQTDAAINPGNSGGPLLNLRGEVIGINTAIASRSGGYNGICFAVPSDIARRVLDDLINNGRVTRGVIGIEPVTLNAEMARKLSLPDDTRGALVASVTKDFPAYKAGLKKGDIITAINGTAITSDSSMRRFVGETKPGTPVRVAYLRNGKPSEVAITVGEMDERALATASTNAVQAYGVTIGPASDEMIQELGLKRGEAVEVAGINRNSPLAGEMAPGMAILSVNGKKTGSPIEFAEAMEAASAAGITKIVVRDSEGDRTVKFRTR